MRITQNSMMRGYNDKLNKVLQNVNKANERVMTGRKFSKGYEDPAGAVKAYQLRREYLKNEDYQNNLRDVEGKLSTAEGSMTSISKTMEDAYVDILRAINDASGQDTKNVTAIKLREMQKSIVMDANAVYGGQFMFGGSSTKEIPFAFDDASGKLTYRGIDVNTTDPAELAQLKALSDEKIFVDLGFGLSFDANGNVVEGSAFNGAMPGIKMLGFGVDANGTPNNIVTLLGKIADELESGNTNTPAFETLTTALDKQRNGMLGNLTRLGSDTKFLEYTKARLENNMYNYNERMVDVELIDPALAITEFQMQDYTYKAALQMGTKILSPSFIDFMR